MAAFSLRNSCRLLVCLAWLCPIPGKAQNKYDVLARVLQPYASLFHSRSPKKALKADVVLLEAPDAASAFLNKPLQISFEMPDKLKIETSDPGPKIVVCRNGQHIWMYPKDLADSLIAAATAHRPDAPPGPPDLQNPEQPLRDFRLPLKDSQLVLLPALFEITRYESLIDSSGHPAFRLVFHLIPQVVENASWSIETIVRQKDDSLEELALHDAGPWTGRVRILRADFSRSLLPETWRPNPVFGPKIQEIPPFLFAAILEKLSGASIQR